MQQHHRQRSSSFVLTTLILGVGSIAANSASAAPVIVSSSEGPWDHVAILEKPGDAPNVAEFAAEYGYECLDLDLNKGAGGDWLFVCLKRTGGQHIVDLATVSDEWEIIGVGGPECADHGRAMTPAMETSWELDPVFGVIPLGTELEYEYPANLNSGVWGGDLISLCPGYDASSHWIMNRLSVAADTNDAGAKLLLPENYRVVNLDSNNIEDLNENAGGHYIYMAHSLKSRYVDALPAPRSPVMDIAWDHTRFAYEFAQPKTIGVNTTDFERITPDAFDHHGTERYAALSARIRLDGLHDMHTILSASRWKESTPRTTFQANRVTLYYRPPFDAMVLDVHNTEHWLDAGSVLDDGAMHDVVVLLDQASPTALSASLYIDGQLLDSIPIRQDGLQAFSLTEDLHDSVVLLGQDQDGPGGVLDANQSLYGQIESFEVLYSNILTPAEIVAYLAPDDDSGSCVSNCGEGEVLMPNGQTCGCDMACLQLGDCCEDFIPECAGGSCEGACGGAGSSDFYQCYCDEECSTIGDCCGDYQAVCG